MVNGNGDMNEGDVRQILKSFRVNTEDELVDEVNNTWYISNCVRCGKELDLTTCMYDDGDPVCRGGCFHG